MIPGNRAGAVIFVWLAATAASAAAALPEGLQPEPSAVVSVGRAALGLWGLGLLAAGRRLPRFAVGSFFLLVGLAVGWAQLAATGYLLTVAAAALVLACGLLLHAAAPRAAMALAVCWPLPAVYLAHVVLGGGFTQSQPVLLTLLLLGAALGAVLPEAAISVLGAALGTVLLAVAWGGEPHFWPLLAIALVATAWQLALPRLLRPPLVDRGPSTLRRRVTDALRASGGGAVTLLAGLLFVVLAAPQPEPAGGARTTRLAAVRDATGGVPSLVLGAENNFYLFGRALPVSLLGGERSAAGRLRAALLGRSAVAALTSARTVKDADELATMRRAAAITASAFRAAAPLIRPGANERDIEAAVLAAFRAGGATGVAFRSVVGSGANAVLPHYRTNDAEMRAGLLVLDIGCSVDGYASDMTRTFPVSGVWNQPEQRLLDAGLVAKAEARAALKPGATLKELNRRAHESIERAGFGPYFIHGLGHHVGLDVHDVRADTLAAGMVVTIEPGIYIPAGAAIDRAYWDLGIRVEDTYLVTKEGGVPLADLPEVLPSGPAA